MKKNFLKGQFIVFEGLDGSGQSTQVRLLTEFLKSQGKVVLATKEPTRTSPVAREIKNILNKKKRVNPEVLQKLFAQDRKWHLQKVIIPALQKNKVVISDRYFFSSFAYGMAEGLKLKYLKEINKDFLIPDIVFYLQASPQTCLKRIEKRGEGKTLFETLEKLTKVTNFYQKVLAAFKNKSSVYIINAEKTIEQTAKEIQEILQSSST